MAIEVIDAHELRRRMEAGEPLRLVDVREQDEWNFCRLPGAEWVPLSVFAREAPVRLGMDEPLVIYCHHGIRSLHAAKFLEQMGYRKLTNLSGGIDAWSRLIDPSVPVY